MRDNAKDRATGAYWEGEFAKLAAAHGLMFTPHQLATTEKSAVAYSRERGQLKPWLLPDVTIWSAPGEHHEIKHKNPTRHGCYGLEDYRLAALLRFARETRQSVLYTIHDWQAAGAANGGERIPNRLDDWVTADVTELAKRPYKEGRGTSSYIAGLLQPATIYYWKVSDFMPLGAWWWTFPLSGEAS